MEFKRALDQRERMAAGAYVDRSRREDMLTRLFGDNWDEVRGECDYITDDDCEVIGDDGEPLWEGHPLVMPLVRMRQQEFVDYVCRYSVSDLVRMAIEGHVGHRLLEQRTRRLGAGSSASPLPPGGVEGGEVEGAESESSEECLGDDLPSDGSLGDGAGDSDGGGMGDFA